MDAPCRRPISKDSIYTVKLLLATSILHPISEENDHFKHRRHQHIRLTSMKSEHQYITVPYGKVSQKKTRTKRQEQLLRQNS